MGAGSRGEIRFAGGAGAFELRDLRAGGLLVESSPTPGLYLAFPILTSVQAEQVYSSSNKPRRY
ncbi:MAG: hypothetical protein DMF61_23165 [Blastocatellia bacterium AA13]|nr:MAG: hypothetical protein DMF61_23165 [Blastocatellia bacterium AA13]